MCVCPTPHTHCSGGGGGERKYDDRELKREGSTKMHQIELFLNARRVFCSSRERERSSDRQVLYAQSECINEVKQDYHVVCSLIKSDYGRPANLLVGRT